MRDVSARDRMLEAMRVRARLELDAGTAAHLIGNAIGALLILREFGEAHDDVADVLTRRIEQDRAIRRTHPDYPHAYPEDIAALVQDLAGIWRAYD